MGLLQNKTWLLSNIRMILYLSHTQAHCMTQTMTLEAEAPALAAGTC